MRIKGKPLTVFKTSSASAVALGLERAGRTVAPAVSTCRPPGAGPQRVRSQALGT